MARVHLKRAARFLGNVTAAGAVGGATTAVYLYQTRPGFERAVRFWCHAGPVVAHYWWERTCSKDEVDLEARYERLHQQHAPDVLRTIEDLRGMFIKVGQVLSVRPEAVPDAIRAELRKVQDGAPPAQWEAIRTVLERDLGAPISELFEHIDAQPLGAASIGQAHLVQWHGQPAVVKVKYPDADEMLRADFWCLETLLWLLSKTEALSLVSMLRKQFEVELDYAQEAEFLHEAHAALAASAFSDRVAVPQPIPELTRGNVVGMTYLPGPKLESVLRARLKALGVNIEGRSFDEMLRVSAQHRAGAEGPEVQIAGVGGSTGHSVADAAQASPPSSRLARLGLGLARLLGLDLVMALLRLSVDAKLWMRSLLAPKADSDAGTGTANLDLAGTLQLLLDIHGFQLFFCPFFNGDPHPGNILLLPDGRVGLIDFGQCKRLTDEQRADFAHLFLALADAPSRAGASEEADERIAAAFEALGCRSAKSDRRFLALLPRLMFGSLQQEWFEPGYLKQVLTNDRIEVMPPHMVMAYRASMLLRGLCLTMQHNVSVADAWSVWAQRWLQTAAT